MRNNFSLKIKIFALIFALIFCFAYSDKADCAKLRRTGTDSSNENEYRRNRTVLPRNGDIAVLVEGDNRQHVAMAEAMIIDELVNHGYHVVDDARLAKMRKDAAKSKAVIYVYEGNLSELIKLNAKYNASATVVARISSGTPVVNEFKLYTGTASAAITAVTSKGVRLGGKAAQGKAVGYTTDEARQNAINSAVQEGLSQML